MNGRCELEEMILQALGAAGISDTARQHVAECETCRDLVAADGWMRELAAQPVEQAPLPDATMLWLKSQLLQQDGALRQLRESTTFLQTLGFGFVAFAWAVLMSWKWSAIRSIADLVVSGRNPLQTLNQTMFSMPLIVTLTVLSCATVAVVFHSVMIEE